MIPARTDFDHKFLKVMERIPVGAVKVFGSALLNPKTAADIDIAVPDDDTSTMAYLLNVAEAHGIHPIQVPRCLFDDLHNRLSWKNLCATVDPRLGIVIFGREYDDGDRLVFNPASRTAFPDLREVVRSAKKLTEKHGYRLEASERLRATLQLNGNPSSLADLAYVALTDQIVHILAAFGAIVAGGFFRDEVDGRPPKDIDVFVPAGRDWSGLCFELSTWLEEVEFEKPEGKRVNLRKFRARSHVPGHEMLVIDVIDYGFVHEPEHVVETFDFLCNTLWWDPQRGSTVYGGFGRTPGEVIQCIRDRRLIVGDNLWYKAGLYRALKRWQRFRADGYVADADNTKKYSDYVKMFQTRGSTPC